MYIGLKQRKKGERGEKREWRRGFGRT